MMEVVVTTGATKRAKLESNCHQQHTNTQLFTRRMPFLLPNQVSKLWREYHLIFMQLIVKKVLKTVVIKLCLKNLLC